MQQKFPLLNSPMRQARRLLVWLALISWLSFEFTLNPARPSLAQTQTEPSITGPYVGKTVEPTIFTGSLLDLPASDEAGIINPQPLRYTPGQTPKGASTAVLNWKDPVAQTELVPGLMPDPLLTFAGISNYSQPNLSWPPDTNGDVGGDYYIQTVNTSIAIFNKTTGVLITQVSFNQFFPNDGSPCERDHSGDPVVVYDRFAERWVITDFKVSANGPFYECVAVSATSDLVSGGWYYYSILISATALNDYPKVGVWRDSYFITFNMFSNYGNSWGGVQVWALEKARMINGLPVTPIYFSLSAASGYASLLPAHALSLPPAGAPNYLAAVELPGDLLIWKFTPNWSNPGLSTFTGPTMLNVAPFAAAASIPQPGSAYLLDSLSYRPMMQLIYRMVNGVEALWLTHTVASGGVAGMRWYEIRQPASTPVLFQQGTYQPDSHHRWMGSLAVDQDGNMALGYSIGSAAMYPSIRYTGRLAGETLGLLPQGEKTLHNGTGSQSYYTRWGDYSAMAVDAADDCTFYYTTEYYVSGSPPASTDWLTRIGSFRFPSCGLPKGRIRGVVRNATTLQPIPGVQVVANSAAQKMTVTTDAGGVYTITLAAGTFSLTAGPLPPGYPVATTINNVPLIANNTTNQDIFLGPTASLVTNAQIVDDDVPGGNNNGHPEPGETDLKLWLTIENVGAADSTNVTAQLSSLSPGVTITQDTAAYPDIAAGSTQTGLQPFVFSVDRSVVCGSAINFRALVTDDIRTYTLDFSLAAAAPLPRVNLINHTVENGAEGWVTGGSPNTWTIISSSWRSPSHSWTDSPGGNYADNTTSYLQSPPLSTWYMNKLQVSFWTRFALEPGYDYVFLDYSTNGGATWSSDSQALATLNGTQATWNNVLVEIPGLRNQSNLVFRFRLTTDSGVTDDGVYLDDFVLSYEPYTCEYGMQPSLFLPLLSR